MESMGYNFAEWTSRGPMTEGLVLGKGEMPFRNISHRRPLTQTAITPKAPLKAAAVPRYGNPRAKSLIPKNGKAVGNSPSEPLKLSAAEKRKRSMTVGAEMGREERDFAASRRIQATRKEIPLAVSTTSGQNGGQPSAGSSSTGRIGRPFEIPANLEAEDDGPPMLDPTEAARARMVEQDAESQRFFDRLGSANNGGQGKKSVSAATDSTDVKLGSVPTPPPTPSSPAPTATSTLRRPSYAPAAALQSSSPHYPSGSTFPSSHRGPLGNAPPRSHTLDSQHPLAHNYYEIDTYYRQEAYDASQAEMEELVRERQVERQEAKERQDKLIWENTELRGKLLDRDRESKENDAKKEAEFEKEREKLRRKNMDLVLAAAEKVLAPKESKDKEAKYKALEEKYRVLEERYKVEVEEKRVVEEKNKVQEEENGVLREEKGLVEEKYSRLRSKVADMVEAGIGGTAV